MVRLSDGDRSAFDVLLVELWPVVRSFAERGGGRGMDAEDIAQEVFFKICSRIADFDRTRDGMSWAFGIASYEILTHRRRQQRRREVYDEPQLSALVDGGASQEELMIQRQMELALEQAVGTLTDEDRKSLRLQQAEEPCGVSTAARRKRKQRALDRLRSLWRHIYGES